MFKKGKKIKSIIAIGVVTVALAMPQGIEARGAHASHSSSHSSSHVSSSRSSSVRSSSSVSKSSSSIKASTPKSTSKPSSTSKSTTKTSTKSSTASSGKVDSAKFSTKPSSTKATSKTATKTSSSSKYTKYYSVKSKPVKHVVSSPTYYTHYSSTPYYDNDLSFFRTYALMNLLNNHNNPSERDIAKELEQRGYNQAEVNDILTGAKQEKQQKDKDTKSEIDKLRSENYKLKEKAKSLKMWNILLILGSLGVIVIACVIGTKDKY